MEKFLILNIGRAMELKLMGPVDTLDAALKKCESGVAYFETANKKQWVVAVDKIVAVSLR